MEKETPSLSVAWALRGAVFICTNGEARNGTKALYRAFSTLVKHGCLSSLQSGVNRFAFESEHTKYTFVNPSKRFAGNEALQGFKSEGELPRRQ